MRKQARQSGRFGRIRINSVLLFLAAVALIASTRIVWHVEASAKVTQSAFAPIVLGEDQGPTAIATPIPTSTTTSVWTETSTATATATTASTTVPTITPSVTSTAEPTHTPTSTPTDTATPTLTPTVTETSTETPTGTPTETPTETSTPQVTETPVPTEEPENTPTSTSTSAAPGEELLVYDLNREVTKADRGFPYGDAAITAAGNIDWTDPIDFAGGTLYFRAEIYDQPVPKEMKLGLCFWQNGTTLENCGPNGSLTGEPGTILTWSVEVSKMYKKNGLPIDWSSPRSRVRVAIKTKNGVPVSDIGDWNWGGDDPDEWYPLNMRFTAVVVEKGASFSGWGNYP